MKKIILISISIFALLLVSCKKKGVCTCSENGGTYKIYYDELSASEKKALKRSCNGKDSGKVVKVESTYNGVTVTDNSPDDEGFGNNCEWSRNGKD